MKPVNPYTFRSNQEIFGQPPSAKGISKPGAANAQLKALANERTTSKGSLQVNEYVKLMNALENSIEAGELSQKQTKQILTVFENKFDSLPQKRKEKVEGSETYKVAFQDEKMEPQTLGEKLTEKIFYSEEGKKEAFDFLKSKEFVAMLRDEDMEPNFSPYKNGALS